MYHSSMRCVTISCEGSGGGGPRPHSWVSSLRSCSSTVRTSPIGRDGRGLRRLDRLVPPRHAHDKLHVVGIPKALDVHVLPAHPARPTRSRVAAMRAQEAARKALRRMHRGDRSGWRYVVELSATKVPHWMPHWNSHMVVLSYTKPNTFAVAKAFPAAYHTMKATTVWLHVICLPNCCNGSAIWLAPSTARDNSRQHTVTRGRGFPLRSFGTSSPYQHVGNKGDQVWEFVSTLGS